MTDKRRKLIALDNSALQRLWDAPTSMLVMSQAAAVREILKMLEAGDQRFLLTWALWWEIDRVADVDRRARALATLPEHSVYAGDTAATRALYRECANLGLAALDAQHVAMAWYGGADVLFTTDNDILAFGERHGDQVPGLKIADPCDWLEVL